MSCYKTTEPKQKFNARRGGRNMMTKRDVVSIVIAAALACSTIGAFAEGTARASGQSTTCTHTIATLAAGAVGVNINSAGVWCLTANLTYNDSGLAGKALDVNAGDVTIDLNGFWLVYAGSNVASVAIYTNSGALAVQNGNIQGFPNGIEFDTFSWNPIVTDVNILQINGFGIEVLGGSPSPFHTVIRRVVINGNASGGGVNGIYLAGTDANVSDCYIDGYSGTGGTGIEFNGPGSISADSNRISSWATGIQLTSSAQYASITNNTITSTTKAIDEEASYAILVNNRLIKATTGIFLAAGSTTIMKYMDTVTAGVTTPWTACPGTATCTSIANNN